MIDPNIALAGKPAQIDPIQTAGRLQSLRTAGIQQQDDQLKLNQDTQSAQDDADSRAAFAAGMTTDPATGQVTFDRSKALNAIGKLNPAKAVQMSAQFATQDQAAQTAKVALTKAQADAQKAQLQAATAHVGAVDQLLQGVSDQATYTSALQHAMSLGIVQPGELPMQYDPQLVQRLHANALTQKEVLDQHQKDADLAEKTQHDTAMEAHEADTVPLATQATRIYAIPAAQRTAQQNAFITGYEKNNDVTKIAPAQVRANVMLQMPQQVVDPNDPSKVTYVSRKDAIGQEAPASGEAAGARKVLTSAIGGKLGDTINSYNTALAHLDMLSQAADALYNGNLRVLNQIGNEFSKQTGNPAPTNFQAVKQAVAGEISKTFKGGQATDAENREADKAIDAANSPKQLQGVINTYKGLMGSKRSAIQQQVQQGMQGKPNFGGSDANTVTAPNGKTYHFPDAAAAAKFKAAAGIQ
jgi:hypothetical protein